MPFTFPPHPLATGSNNDGGEEPVFVVNRFIKTNDWSQNTIKLHSFYILLSLAFFMKSVEHQRNMVFTCIEIHNRKLLKKPQTNKPKPVKSLWSLAVSARHFVWTQFQLLHIAMLYINRKGTFPDSTIQVNNDL